MTATFFNLLVNAAFSMACGLLIVGFFVWLFRVDTGPWKLFLLSLPFVKLVYDSTRGLPPDSVLFSGIDPFALPPKHQLLQIGLGLSYWGPNFNLIFSVRDTSGREFASSVGDYLVLWLNRTFGSQVSLAILCAVLSVSATLLIIRIISAVRFEHYRRTDRTNSHMLRIEKTGLRRVDIYTSETFTGSPFTGGLLRPYVCIPTKSYLRLSSEELEAVIAHELGHVKQFDLAVTIVIQILGDVFWFVPGYRQLSRKIDRLREIVADQWAVRSGADPLALASALVNLRELPQASGRFVLYSAFFREESLLKIRIERLLGTINDQPPRFGWGNIWFRSFISLWIFAAVMIATLGGNHQSLKLKNPEWFSSLLRDLGLQLLN